MTAPPKGLDVPLFALLGLPMYVCSIVGDTACRGADSQRHFTRCCGGFPLTGPATNATTYGVLAQLHGETGCGAVRCGDCCADHLAWLLINHILGNSTGYPFHVGHDHSGILYPACLLLLFLLFATSFLRQGPRGLHTPALSGFIDGHVIP